MNARQTPGGMPDMSDPATIPVIAIGGSAGALEPLEAFFQNAPVENGWCYIVVQHLSPDYRSMMDSLLSRRSSMNICHIEDGLALAPNTIFLNKPNTTSVVTKHGIFKTTPYRSDAKLPHLPIDALFRSLVSRSPQNTVAVVLSGSGGDGSIGGQLLHAAGATVIAQTPSEAAFTSMPRALMALGVADHVSLAGDMPELIAGALNAPPDGDGPRMSGDASRTIMTLLERQHHLDIASYKSISVNRRIHRRMSLRGEQSLETYVKKLESDPQLLDELYHDLLIGVTEFYRDPESIKALRKEVIDPLVARSAADRPLRIWVPGCSSGEEAYTIAIEVSESLRAAGQSPDFRIIATDIHRRSIDIASAGAYPVSAFDKVDPELTDRYFRREGDTYYVEQRLRQKIIFSVNDVLSDPPLLNIDLISCRNLLIYLRQDAQKRVISMFLFGLRQNGVLMLGPSETLGKLSEDFEVLDGRWRIFRKVTANRPFSASFVSDRMGLANRLNQPQEPQHPHTISLATSSTSAVLRNRDALIKGYNSLLKRHAPSSILITANGEVLSWFGSAAAFIDTKNNLADWTVDEIVHPDLHTVINVGVEKLRTGETIPLTRAVQIDLGEGRVEQCTVFIEPLDLNEHPILILVRVTLNDLPEVEAALTARRIDPEVSGNDAQILSKRVRELERDLKFTEETLQHITERLEASSEELQASNEELQASNEELQASNEELQSSNEELHAVNEELITVSAEHERKIELLSVLNRQTESVMEILRIGTIFIDNDMQITRFSMLIGNWFGLERHDVNRKVSVIGPRMTFCDLPTAAQRVMKSGTSEFFFGQHENVTLRVEVHRTTGAHAPSIGDGVVAIFRQGDDIRHDG
ncbi:putative biofilm formation methyltransferase WspC [Aquimixticola soesokkakensis]|uniref:Putative biofilm formation methyltransferase WspC n=1 Tax=Aquimixticola soesokkakensis TaxID=1519096 RepID=A0A1Y5TGL2_9RHOB|nr:CheR family methyltransferase [Aquimixticola soesokkakensis]SLN63594.1 putative biofilm formation methyltransferase WspC [Aquimixticola soesokkakensis]